MLTPPVTSPSAVLRVCGAGTDPFDEVESAAQQSHFGAQMLILSGQSLGCTRREEAEHTGRRFAVSPSSHVCARLLSAGPVAVAVVCCAVFSLDL